MYIMCIYIYIYTYIYITNMCYKDRDSENERPTDRENPQTWASKRGKVPRCLVGRNVFIFMRGSCAVHAQGAGPMTWTSTLTLPGTGNRKAKHTAIQ